MDNPPQTKPVNPLQPIFFPSGEDLPLMSGTAPRAVIVPFVPKRPAPEQLSLPLSEDTSPQKPG